MRLWIDTETYSETPIKYGTYRYAADAEVMIVSWAVDDGPVQVLDLTASAVLDEFLYYAAKADEVIAHNAMFDRNVLRRFAPSIEKWRCTMVKAMAHSLPGSLDKLCEILGVPLDQRKLKAGKELVQLFCKPRPKNQKLRRATRDTHPQEWARFLEYAGQDIEAMRQVDKRLPVWNYRDAELALWHLDQRINDRGFAVDLEFAQAAMAAAEREQARLAAATAEHTNGAVASATHRDALLEHILAEYGVALPDMQGSTLERRINDPDLPEGLRELLAIRMQASATSTSKYGAIQRGAVEGRMRGTLQFCGAGRTGRWAGRTFQPQNLSRVPKYLKDQWEPAITSIKTGVVDLVYDNVMEVIGSTVRGVIVAPEGRKLVVADLSNIEGRMLAWLGGEEWKLHAFREFDAGRGHDLYKLAYAKAFRIAPSEVDEWRRQIGKVLELMLGYEGGVGAFMTGALTYGFDIEQMAKKAWDALPRDLVDEATEFHAWTAKQGRSAFGLSREAFITCDVFKRGWRRAHPNVVALWKELQAACINATETPGQTFECRRFKVRRDGQWLRISLPSGRALCYPQPRVEDGKLSYMGVNQYTRKWQRIATYGGKLVENATQSAARGVLAASMPHVDAAGYEIVLTVHDELITETPDTAEYNSAALSAMMSHVPEWATGLPLAAAGFEAYRYRKG